MLNRDKNSTMEPPRKDTSANPAHKLPEAAIRIGAQMGDESASEVVTPHFMELKAKIKQICKKSYSDEIHEFSFVVRVDGEIWHWNLEGCARMRLHRRENYITIDLYMPRHRWDGVCDREIRVYLAEHVELGLNSMLSKLQREKISVDQSSLLHDFAKVKSAYLQ